MRLGLLMLATFALLVLCTPARADDNCVVVSEIVADVEKAGFTGAYAQGSYIYPGRVPEDCRTAMADALAAYRERMSGLLVGSAHTRYRHYLFWEEAQWAAKAGHYGRAADLTRRAMAEQHNQPDAYFAAIGAFLERNRAAYDAAHQQLKRDVQVRYYSSANEGASRVGDLLIAGSEALGACWDRPFTEAFSLVCSAPIIDRLAHERRD